ncbi:MAG: hypothetical protein V9E83_00825 [Baekduia sp.]
MTKHVLALTAGALIAVSAAQTAAAVDVKVRVEGEAATLVSEQTVTVPTTAPKPDGVNECAAGSAGAALWQATGGAWGGVHYSFGWLIDSIKGERYSFPDPRSWEFWINGKSASTGACDTQVSEGDTLLFIVQRCEMDANYECTNPPVLPLAIRMIPTGAPGVPFTVETSTVNKDGTISNVVGGWVSGGGDFAELASNGNARLATLQRGPVLITAQAPNRVRVSRTICITDGADGYCGTTAAPGVTPPPPGTVTGESCTTNGRDGLCGTSDSTRPVAATSSLHGAVFARRKAPRQLRGTVPADGSGITKVELRLTRTRGSRCESYSDAAERWVVRRRCGTTGGSWFSVGSGTSWNYFLPERLAAGRYVLDVRVTDGAGNSSQLARGTTRSVFHVR